jgi:putative nucleotidyltransferase with HDIG domain/PAS domain S-box-containing protein
MDEELLGQGNNMHITSPSSADQATPRLSPAMAEHILKAINDPITVIDRNFKVVWTNDNELHTCKHQWSLPEMKGRHCYEMFEKKQRVFDDCPVAETFRTNRPSTRECFTGLSGEKGTWTESINWPIFNGQGEILYVVQYSRDITARKLAEKALQETEKNLKQSFEGLQSILEETVIALSSTVAMRDPYTGGHQKRVAKLVCAIAQEMNFPAEQIDGLRTAAILHDIGKIQIPADILNKPGALTHHELELIKTHAQTGYDILKRVPFPWPVAKIILQHHERLDGSGYPLGLSGEDILTEAKVICVADVVEGMASHRPYRAAHGLPKALEEVQQYRGVLYDGEIVDACLRVFKNTPFTFEVL